MVRFVVEFGSVDISQSFHLVRAQTRRLAWLLPMVLLVTSTACDDEDPAGTGSDGVGTSAQDTNSQLGSTTSGQGTSAGDAEGSQGSTSLSATTSGDPSTTGGDTATGTGTGADSTGSTSDSASTTQGTSSEADTGESSSSADDESSGSESGDDMQDTGDQGDPCEEIDLPDETPDQCSTTTGNDVVITFINRCDWSRFAVVELDADCNEETVRMVKAGDIYNHTTDAGTVLRLRAQGGSKRLMAEVGAAVSDRSVALP